MTDGAAIPYAEVIGDPIGHSKSPLIHRVWLERLGIEAEYRACRVPRGDLEAYLAARRSDPHWRGCNVTMPLKTEILPCLDEVDAEAQRLGAVNCVTPAGRGLRGANFDATAIAELMASRSWHGHAVLIGSGGAARAGLWAIARAGFDSITVMARDGKKARLMIESLGVLARTVEFNARPACDLLMNATPLGMKGQPPLDIGVDGMPDGSTLFDMVYDPVETPLLAAGRRRGFALIDGLDMLVGQAASSFAAFFGRAPDQGCRSHLRGLLAQ